MKSRTIKAVAVAFLALLSLSSCRLGRGEGEGSGAGVQTDDDRKKELVFWSTVTEDAPLSHALAMAIEDYEKANPGVSIRHEAFADEDYKAKIKDAALSEGLPDLFLSWGGEFFRSFVEEGRAMELDPYYNSEFRKLLPEIALTNAIYDGRLYGVTYVTDVSLLFYNKKIFDKYHLRPPETWADWKELCAYFLEKEVRPLGASVKDTWSMAMYLDAMTLKNVGPEKTHLTLTGGGGSFRRPEFLKPIQDLEQWVKEGAFIEGAAKLTNDEASALFYSGDVPMFVTGSWMANAIVTDAENPEDFSVTTVPVRNRQNAKETDFVGGALDMFMVAENTRYPSAAGKAAFGLARSLSKHSYLEGVGMAAWKIDYDDARVHPLARQIADYTANATSFTLWFDTLMEGEDAGKYLYLLGELYEGNVTPKQFVEEMAEQLEN